MNAATKHTAAPGLFRGFLGNGAWMLAVHTKSCCRQRRRVTPGERTRSLVPNRAEQFAQAARSRRDTSSATGATQ